MSNTIDAYIEIPRGNKNKYEFDFETKTLRFDRVLNTSMLYPTDYGFVPETLALDGDPLDVLVLFSFPTVPGIVAEVRPIGVLHMSDEKGRDEKILCVPVDDPVQNELKTFADVSEHLKKEIEHFFKVYKDLEDKHVHVEQWGDETEAEELVAQSIQRYQDQKDKTFTLV